MRSWNSVPILIIASLVAVFSSGCSAFNYEWRQAARKPTPTNGIAGRWDGTWLSHANGHNDRLRCLVTQVDTNHFDARFHAAYSLPGLKWLKVHFGYTVRMETKAAGDGVTFRGEENLGALAGGVYRYEGNASNTNFFSTYKCKYDHGVFQMHRPE